MWSYKNVSTVVPRLSRSISLSAVREGKRNFRKFILPSRGTRQFKEDYAKGKIKLDYGPKPRGELPITLTMEDGSEVVIPEKIPELIVPDLTDTKLKPYVSYRAPDVHQDTFTPQDLFKAVYRKKIVRDFLNGKLDQDGKSLEPSAEENLTSQKAFENARKTGSDIF